MLKRDDYIEIIEEIRNTEKIAISEYIEKTLIPLKTSNQFFIETLYKDIFFILDGLAMPGDGDLIIENGDFVVEDGDFVVEDGDYKLSGYQTRLDDVLIWLHMNLLQKSFTDFESPEKLNERIKGFENRFLNSSTYTPEYRNKLIRIRQSIKTERSNNTKGIKYKINRLFDPDILELKPNIGGIGINFNEIINRLRNKNK